METLVKFSVIFLLLFNFSGVYSQPTLEIYVEDGFNENLLNSLQKEIHKSFNVKLELIQAEDIGKGANLVQSVIDGSLLNIHEVIKENSTYYLFLTNRKLFWESLPSDALRGFANYNESFGVISSHRIKNESDSLGLPYSFQFIKAVKHEYLHLLGLNHCDSTPRCLMVSSFQSNNSSFPPNNFYTSFDRICTICFEKIDTSLVNEELILH